MEPISFHREVTKNNKRIINTATLSVYKYVQRSKYHLLALRDRDKVGEGGKTEEGKTKRHREKAHILMFLPLLVPTYIGFVIVFILMALLEALHQRLRSGRISSGL